MKKVAIQFITFLFIYNTSFGTDIIEFNKALNVFDPLKYNSLPSAEEADAKLKDSNNFAEFSKEARSLVQRFGFESFFGMRLLHNHSFVDSKYAMVEHTEETASGIAFITEHSLLTGKTKKDIVPASWIFVDNGYVVFEYSQDKEVVPLYHKLTANLLFLKSFHGLLKEYGFESLISPTIIGGNKLEMIEGSQEYGLVEETFFDPFRSIVSYSNLAEFDKFELIDTLWFLGESDEDSQLGCVNRCFRGVGTCTRRGSGHGRQWVHYRSHIKM